MKKRLSLIIMLLMSSVSAQYALMKSDPFLEGDWREGERSLYCSSRIEVDIWESLLTISSNTLRSDVTIRISQNDETMFEVFTYQARGPSEMIGIPSSCSTYMK